MSTLKQHRLAEYYASSCRRIPRRKLGVLAQEQTGPNGTNQNTSRCVTLTPSVSRAPAQRQTPYSAWQLVANGVNSRFEGSERLLHVRLVMANPDVDLTGRLEHTVLQEGFVENLILRLVGAHG
jgi:hypothetical protein